MSRNVSTLFVEEFESSVHHNYQGMELLRGTVRTKRGVVGNQVHFPVMGKTRAYPKVHRAPVVPANLSMTRPTANLADWHISDLTDVFEDIKTNVDERQNLGKSFSMAMGRQEDQEVLEHLGNGSYGSNNRNTQIGNNPNTQFKPDLTTTDVTRPAKLIGIMVAQLRNRGVMKMEKLTGALPAIWEADFITDPAISSRDFGPDPNNATRTGMAPRTYGVDLIFIDDRKETATDPSNLGQGYDSAAGTGYVYAESALGIAYGKDPTLDIDWQPLYTSWLVTLCMSLGGVMIDNDGVQRCTNGPTAI